MSDCIFCKIANNEIPSNKVYEDEFLCAFHDINKEAPVHILIIPKKHIESVNQLENDDQMLIGKIFMLAKKLSKELEIDNTGYRIVNNCGKNGGQTVSHIHFHLMGNRAFSWPPG